MKHHQVPVLQIPSVSVLCYSLQLIMNERFLVYLKKSLQLLLLSCMGILSCAKCIILGPVEYITNMFAQEEVFPSKLKEVKVIPVYKSGNESDPCNCRPTSLLSIFSCIFEKMMYHGPKDVLDKNDVVFKSQCGFCEMHST